MFGCNSHVLSAAIMLLHSDLETQLCTEITEEEKSKKHWYSEIQMCFVL